MIIRLGCSIALSLILSFLQPSHAVEFQKIYTDTGIQKPRPFDKDELRLLEEELRKRGESLTPQEIEEIKKILEKKAFPERKKEELTSKPEVIEKPKEKEPGPEKALRPQEVVEKEEPSEIEKFVSGKIPPQISTDLKQFGYDLFLRPPETFAPIEEVSVEPDYLLGPGDEIKINLWGRIDGDYSITVDRDGNLSIPKLGVLNVAGLTFEEAKRVIKTEYSRYYKDFQINITMGRLRGIKVFVVGRARRPGSYTISSFSTLINALFSAGGPSKVGSMRRIELKRGNRTIVEFDLYDFITKGDKSRDIRLQAGDVIFIPPIGPTVAVAGHVKVPAIYEIKGPTRLFELVEMAGGFTAPAYAGQIQVERVFERESKIIIDRKLKDLNGSDANENIILMDGDIVKVFPIPTVVKNEIRLEGNVARPGSYAWKEGIRVSDVVRSPEDLLPDTYFEFALIERMVPPDFHRIVVPFNLGKAMLHKDKEEDKELRPFDKITIYNKWQLIEKPVVRVQGAVNKPGDFHLSSGMRVLDLIKIAGGLKRYAFLDRAELTRIHITPSGPRTELVIINLSKILEGDERENILLQQDDYLFIRSIPDWHLYNLVEVKGEVNFPGTYAVKKGETISSLIRRAGGFTNKAFLKGAIFTRESIKAQQQKKLDEYIESLEREVIAAASAAQQKALSPEEAAFQREAYEKRKSLIEKLRQIKATGRMVIHLTHLELFTGSKYDIELKDGDSLFVPDVPNYVNVFGSVFNPGAIIFTPGTTIEKYIETAGGPTRNADTSSIYVIKADGTTISKRQEKWFGLRWDPDQYRWVIGRFMSTKLEQGDTVVVPEEVEKIAWMRELKDLTQILFQIAVATGVVVALF